MTERKEKYPAEVTKVIVETYMAAETDEARKLAVEIMATELPYTVGEIRGKLVSEKVYVRPAKVRKTVGLKADLITAIAVALELEEEQIGTLEKGTKEALTFVFGRVNALRAEAGLETVAVVAK